MESADPTSRTAARGDTKTLHMLAATDRACFGEGSLAAVLARVTRQWRRTPPTSLRSHLCGPEVQDEPGLADAWQTCCVHGKEAIVNAFA